MFAPVACRLCGSAKVTELHSEMNIHFPELRSPEHPPIFAFPKLMVCLDCGLTESRLSDAELMHVREAALGSVRISL